jgi:hypothetical protein
MTLHTPSVAAGNDPVRAQPKIIPPNQAALEAIAHTREAAIAARQATDRLLEITELSQTPPELRTIIINPGNSGNYVTLDQSRFEAKSIGIFNPTNVIVYLGIGGISATPTSRALSCPPQSLLVLPLAVRNLELGCDPAVLLGSTAVVHVFRYLTVQQLKLNDAV